MKCWDKLIFFLFVLAMCLQIGSCHYESKRDEQWNKLAADKNCGAEIMSINGKKEVAYQCGDKTYLKLDLKVLEIK